MKSKRTGPASSLVDSSAATNAPTGSSPVVRNGGRLHVGRFRRASASARAAGTPHAASTAANRSARSPWTTAGGFAPIRCGFQSADGATAFPSPQPAEVVSTNAVPPRAALMSACRSSSCPSSSWERGARRRPFRPFLRLDAVRGWRPGFRSPWPIPGGLRLARA